jgi:hypothetical protein
MPHSLTAFSRRHTRTSESRSLGIPLLVCSRCSTTPIAPSEVPCTGIAPRLGRLNFLLVAAASLSCSSPPTSPGPSTFPSSPTAIYIVAPGQSMTLSRTGQTVQLSATAAFPTGPDPQAPFSQTVTAIATWQSSNPAVATVSGGLVTAVAAGTLTITATYQGKIGTLNLTVALGSVMTAAIDGAAFNAIQVYLLKTGALQIFMSGSSALTDPHLVLDIAVPAAVGTYDLRSQAESAWASLTETTTPLVWSTDVIGGSGTITVSTLTLTSASGTFSLTLAPARGMPTDTKVVTNGVFSVLF